MKSKLHVVVAAHYAIFAISLIILYHILPCCISNYYFLAANGLFYSVLSWYSLSATKKFFLSEKIVPFNKAVLITGCDSGFGHQLAKRLDSKGFKVFATCMFPSGPGAEELRRCCSSRLLILELDVTKDDSVQKAVEFVEQNLGSSELWAIVNNAGIGKGLSVLLTGIQDFRDCMEVNVYGGVRVTKAFFPFLKKSKGRVVNITSIAGRVCMPHVAPYIVSKYAAVGFSDLLRQELTDWEISVISIEPEMFRTGLTDKEKADKLTKEVFSEMNESLRVDYDEDYQKNFQKSRNFFLSLAGGDIQVVIDDLESAVSLVHPDVVYSPRRNAFVRLILFIYVVSPIPLRDFFVKLSLRFVRYQKPKKR